MNCVRCVKATDGLSSAPPNPNPQFVPAGRDALRLAEAASYGWGRLVRSPRLRGGHVILDMCVGPQHHYPEGLGSATADPRAVPSAAVATADGEVAAVGTDAASLEGGSVTVGHEDEGTGSSQEGFASDGASPQGVEDGRLVQQVRGSKFQDSRTARGHIGR